jgi:hypothetical protein
MIAILQWTTLAVCAVVTLARIPSALRGHNRSLFFIFALMTIAILLSIDAPYRVIDAWLGSQNYANLILRFVIYVGFFLAGVRIAKAFNSARAVKLLRGLLGLSVLGVIMAATAVLFVLADTEGTATGLSGLRERSPENFRFIELYGTAGRLYPAFVAACLLPSSIRVAAGRLPAVIRWGAALLTVSFAGIVLSSVIPFLPSSGFLHFVVNYTAALTLVLGLTVIWVGRISATRKSTGRVASQSGSRTET